MMVALPAMMAALLATAAADSDCPAENTTATSPANVESSDRFGGGVAGRVTGTSTRFAGLTAAALADGDALAASYDGSGSRASA